MFIRKGMHKIWRLFVWVKNTVVKEVKGKGVHHEKVRSIYRISIFFIINSFSQTVAKSSANCRLSEPDFCNGPFVLECGNVRGPNSFSECPKTYDFR